MVVMVEVCVCVGGGGGVWLFFLIKENILVSIH